LAVNWVKRYYLFGDMICNILAEALTG
jgi:hypothetical protein